MATENLSIVIGAVDRASAQIKAIESSMTGLRGAMGAVTRAAGLLGLSLGAAGLVSFLRSSVQAAAADETAMLRLAAAVNGAGQSWRDAAPEVQAVLTRIQQTTQYTDDQAAGALQRIIQLTGRYEGSLRLLQVATNFSAATGRDLNSTIMLLSRASATGGAGLQRLGISVQGLATGKLDASQKGANLNLILGELERRFGGMSTTVAESTRVMNRLVNEWGEFKESVGRGVLDTLSPLVSALASASTSGVEFGKSLGAAVVSAARAALGLEPLLLALRLFERLKAGATGAAPADLKGMQEDLTAFADLERQAAAETRVFADAERALASVVATEVVTAQTRRAAALVESSKAQREHAKAVRESAEAYRLHQAQFIAGFVEERRAEATRLLTLELERQNIVEEHGADVRAKRLAIGIALAESEEKSVDRIRAATAAAGGLFLIVEDASKRLVAVGVNFEEVGKRAYDALSGLFAAGFADLFETIAGGSEKTGKMFAANMLRGLGQVMVQLGTMMLLAGLGLPFLSGVMPTAAAAAGAIGPGLALIAAGGAAIGIGSAMASKESARTRGAQRDRGLADRSYERGIGGRMRGDGGGGGGQNITIIFSGQPFATRAEIGREVDAAMQAAGRMA